MEKENGKEKTCQNCRFFLRHYVKSRGRINAVNSGQCIKGRIKKRNELVLCEFWEDLQIQKDERRGKIEDRLRTIAETLVEIAVLLESDLSEG